MWNGEARNRHELERLEERVTASERPFFLGIGGGGDIVGALAVAQTLKPGPEPLIGGLTWERRPVDPALRPRRLDELEGVEPLNPSVGWASAATRGPGGYSPAEARVAACLNSTTLIVDPSGGAEMLARDLGDAMEKLGADLIVLVDVGGDVLATGSEHSLISPLCDAVCLAAAPKLQSHVDVVAAVVGAGCDGELTLPEFTDRLGLVTAAGEGLEVRFLSRQAMSAAADVLEHVETEASRFMLACAQGENGPRPIRGGIRTAHLSPYGGIVFLFDPLTALQAAAPLARAAGRGDFFEAADAIRALGARTEIDPGDQRPLHDDNLFANRWLQTS